MVRDVRRQWLVATTMIAASVLLTGCGGLTEASLAALQAHGGSTVTGGPPDTGGAATGGGGASSSGQGTALGGTGSSSTGSTGGGAGTGGGTGGGAGVAAARNGTQSRTGISSSTIRLGLHVPITGAAPVPLNAFQTGAQLFWENHTVFGHQVVMDTLDDQYSPSVARRDCEQLSTKDFMITGVGSDQVVACATDPVLRSSNTPYFGEGINSSGQLSSQPNYFAMSQIWSDQVPAAWRMAQQLYPKEVNGKWAIVTADSAGFDQVTNAEASFLQGHGVQFMTYRLNKYASQQDAANAVTAVRQYGATAVFVMIAPTPFIYMVNAAAQQVYTPAWVGAGITNGVNVGAAAECGEQPTVKAAFMSPMMGIDRAPSGFSNESNPAPDAAPSSRDFELYVYGISEAMYQAMLSVGSIENLTRENILAQLPKFSAVYGQQLTVLPTMTFNGGHFGGRGIWGLQLDCTKQQYVTVGSTFFS